MFKINNKNKIIFILSIVSLTLLCLTTFSQASFNFDYEDKHYDVPNFPEDNNNYYLLVDFNGSLFLFTSSEPITYLDSSKYSGYGEVYGKNGILYILSDTWTVNTEFGSDFWRSNSNNKKYFIYSNYDILDKNNGELVFQAPPQVNQTLTETLVEETTQAQITQQIQTMILGFLKYLTLFVVSVIAFYKGWKFLSTQLRKA